MTERVKKALDEANKEFAEREYENESHYSGFVKGFHWGAKWQLNSVWHKPEDKPEGDSSQAYIILIKDPQFADLDWFFAYYDPEEREVWGVINGYGLRFDNKDIAGWVYVEDILPEWFTATRERV